MVRGSLEGLHGFATETGRPGWSWTVPRRGVLVAMSDQVADGVGLAVHADEDDGRLGRITVTAFEVRSGEVLWSFEPEFDDRRYYSEYDEPMAGMVAAVPGRAVVLSDRHLVARDLRSGRPVWRPRPAGKGTAGRLATAGAGLVQVVVAGGRATVRRIGAAEGSTGPATDLPFDGRVADVHVAHQDPPVLLVEGKGLRASEPALFVLDDRGEVTARIPAVGGHGELVLGRVGIGADRPVVATEEVVVVPTRPGPGAYDHLTAFARAGGGVRWTWRSKERITGLLRVEGSVLVLSKWVAPSGEADGTVHLHVLDGATGRVSAVRRLTTFQVGTEGRFHLDGDRLLRVSDWGHDTWAPVQMFRLR
ncbi:PQQ-binding-like beta-propeller repeat protein [Kitasatospora sp. NPDC056181]|uniref:outer membrane protein assembly factor BamB family protein n=1 Tax=Kitasatospora sp. NPDC056181 TaxID=3345737 RepID=UPI0035E03B10